MFVESAILGTLLLAWLRAGKKKPGELTPERKAVFQAALEVVEDSQKLRDLADIFEKEGLAAQADVLRKRAKLREMSPDLKKARHDAFLTGMKSGNPAQVEQLALMFEGEGAIGAANALRGYAAGLRSGTAAAFVPPPVAVTPAGATPPVAPPPAPSAPSSPTGVSPAPVVAAAGAPSHEVAAAAASTGQTVLPSTSPTGQTSQTPDNPSGLPVTPAPVAPPPSPPSLSTHP